MPTIYSREANPEEVPGVGEIVSLPAEGLDLPSSDIKERQGENEMRFKVVDRRYGTYTEATGGRALDPRRHPYRHQLRGIATRTVSGPRKTEKGETSFRSRPLPRRSARAPTRRGERLLSGYRNAAPARPFPSRPRSGASQPALTPTVRSLSFKLAGLTRVYACPYTPSRAGSNALLRSHCPD